MPSWAIWYILMLVIGTMMITLIILRMSRGHKKVTGYFRDLSDELGWTFALSSRKKGLNPSISGAMREIDIRVEMRREQTSHGGSPGTRWPVDYHARFTGPEETVGMSKRSALDKVRSAARGRRATTEDERFDRAIQSEAANETEFRLYMTSGRRSAVMHLQEHFDHYAVTGSRIKATNFSPPKSEAELRRSISILAKTATTLDIG